IAGRGNLLGRRVRDDDRAVPVGVDEVARAHQHALDADLLAEAREMSKAVAWRDGSRKRLAARCPGRNITDTAVRDHAARAERLVDRRLHLAPERAEANVMAIEVLDAGDGRAGLRGDVLVVSDALLPRGLARKLV